MVNDGGRAGGGTGSGGGSGTPPGGDGSGSYGGGVPNDLARMLEPFGVAADAIVALDAPLGPEHIAHLDLHPHGTHSRFEVRVDAVVEMRGRPILYVKRGPPTGTADLLPLLAQRGAADYIAFAEPGQLTVLPLRPKRKDDRTGRRLRESDDGAGAYLPGLAFGTIQPSGNRAARALNRDLFELLHASTRALTAVDVTPDDALALVGRAVFVRFLLDRGIVTASDLPRIAPSAPTLESAMGTPDGIAATSSWLDRTFNGHLLPLDVGAVLKSRHQQGPICEQLTRILTRTNAAGQTSFSWARLDFGHIPVGLLSEVYESWSHDYRTKEAKRDSVWYTPAGIANFMVEEALRSLDQPHEARVLDPAAGAGVFLVSTYRALVAARWRKDRSRPDRDTVRQILYRQIVGFDVHDAALRLAALALYLTALELDPEPGPGSHVLFEDLRKIGVLRDVSGVDDHQDLPPVGSLAENCGDDLFGAFDVVMGNPPWTAWAVPSGDAKKRRENGAKLDARRRDVEATVTTILRARVEDPTATFAMTQNQPDLPMLWCATRWARPKGVIALAMHASLLFRRTDEGVRARAHVFRGLTVTGVLNGSALRETQVWPQHKAPFALVFARNERSTVGSGFHYVCPVLDRQLNAEGYMRVDPSARHPVIAAELQEQPWLLKTLFRGGPMDAPIVERILGSLEVPLLSEWWPEDFSSRGFIRGKTTKQKPCRELEGRDELFDHDALGVEVPSTALKRCTDATMTEPRTGRWKREYPNEHKQGLAPRVFRGPVVAIRTVPRADPKFALAMMSSGDTLYDDSFLGFSAAWHPEGMRLARYLTVFLNSRIALFTLLMSAARFGVERPTLLLDEVRELRLPRWDDLSEGMQSEVDAAWISLCRSDPLDRAPADKLVGRLFGLSRIDVQCMEDTLSVALPQNVAFSRAEAAPTPEERERFRGRVEAILSPFLRRSKRTVRVGLGVGHAGDPWRLLWISTTDADGSSMDAVMTTALSVAMREGASRVVLVRPGTLLVAVFAQYRYWTLTQARALAMDILDESAWMATLRGDGS